MQPKYKTIIAPKRTMLGMVEHEITVRNIDRGFNIRVFVNGELNQECRCNSRSQIGIVAADMLRWEDKLGNISKYASSARARMFSKQ